MKRIFTLLICLHVFTIGKSQMVLNELYVNPGAGNHEFFELHNNGNSLSPISSQGYTIVTYFEGAGTEKGFYVMDLPDLTVQPKGYLVGSAASPFNYQGVTGSTKTHFSWNNLAFLAANGGYLKKWVLSNLVPAGIDGNSKYDEHSIPANFNDFLSKRSGTGATFSVFVYRYGILVNAFFGGSSSTTVPSFITSMPKLRVSMASGGNFDINFPSYSSISAEFTNADAGSDNGFIRNKDGLCGGWQKSSSTVQHTPNETNGSETGSAGTVLLSAMISRGATPSDYSTLQYKVLSAPASVLPLILDIYIDNGDLVNDLDAPDSLIATRTINSAGSILYEEEFMPYNANILIAIRTAAGCFDKVLLVTSANVILPVKLDNFTGVLQNSSAGLQWQVSDNAAGTIFEVQQSDDGVNFNTIGHVASTATSGIENYSFNTNQNKAEAYYRLKIVNSNAISYSKIIGLSSQLAVSNKGIVLRRNPVDSYLDFSYHSTTGNSVEISIYSLSGAKLYSTRMGAKKGLNTVTLGVGGHIYSGTYVLEVKNATDRAVVKFVKQ